MSDEDWMAAAEAELPSERTLRRRKELAWRAYQDRLGNLTASEEAAHARAWHSGWAACVVFVREEFVEHFCELQRRLICFGDDERH
jgi:hypothetical protein